MANKKKNKATVWNGPDVKLKIEGVAQITRNKQLRREVVIVKRNESMPYSNVEIKQMSANVAMDEINYGKDVLAWQYTDILYSQNNMYNVAMMQHKNKKNGKF